MFISTGVPMMAAVPRNRVLLCCVLGLSGCDARPLEPSAAPPPAPAEAQTPTRPEPPPSPAAPLVAPGLADTLLDWAIEAPTLDDGTYRVDPFVAAYVFDRLTAEPSPGWLATTPEGLRILEGAEPTLRAKLGLEVGDLVADLHGRPPTLDRAALLGDASHEVRVTLTRAGTSFTHSYRLVPGLAWQRIRDAHGAPPAAPENALEPAARPPKTPPTARPPSASTPPTARPSTPERPTASRSGARCETAGRCTLPRATFDRWLNNPAQLQAEVRTAPAIRNDVFSGYWIRAIQAGSAASDLGFRVGDKLTHVNGKALYDDVQALTLYSTLPSTRSFTIRYERNGTPLTKQIVVK